MNKKIGYGLIAVFVAVGVLLGVSGTTQQDSEDVLWMTKTTDVCDKLYNKTIGSGEVYKTYSYFSCINDKVQNQFICTNKFTNETLCDGFYV